jgi:hypothetical protein
MDLDRKQATVSRRPSAGDRQQATVCVGHDVALAPMDLLCGVVAFELPFRSAVLTVWLSMMAAEGEASKLRVRRAPGRP